MIAKISKSGSSFYGAAIYNQNKVDNKQGAILDKHKIMGSKPRQIEQYMKQVSASSRAKKPVFHVALSFSEKDKPKLTDAKLRQISNDYLDGMGYGKQPYIVYRHDDTKHPHVHVLTTRVDIEKGKKIDDSFEQKRSKKVVEKLEKKYGLVLATQQGLKQKRLAPKLVKEVHKALQNAPISIVQLNNSLAKNEAEFRIKKAGRGLVYYKIESSKKQELKQELEQENRISKSWKSSDFKAEGLDKRGLEKAFEANKLDRKELRTIVESSLKETPNQEQKLSLADFEKALARHQVRPKYALNEQGIYGLSYEFKGKKFKASDLGKGHSWNAIKEQIQLPQDIHLREQLKASIENNQPIEVRFKGRDFHFESPNYDLQKRLNAMPNDQATDLTRLHNRYQSEIHNKPFVNEKALMRDLAGHEIDSYLQKQYEYRQRQSQRRIRHRL